MHFSDVRNVFLQRETLNVLIQFKHYQKII